MSISQKSSQSGRRRIVVTGIGVTSPLGRIADDFWKDLVGERGSECSNPSGQPLGKAVFTGTIEDFGDLPKELRRSIRKALKVMNRETQMGVAAGQQALLDSGLTASHDPERIGVCFGADNVSILPEDFEAGIRACTNPAGEYEAENWGSRGLTEVAPLWLLKCLPNMPACHLAILNDLRGPSNTITQRDVAANLAIAEACRIIRDHDADAMLVGASSTLLPVFNRMHAHIEHEICDESTIPCAPFDRRHTGPAPGEGSAAVVLEELNSALARGAVIYGEILGTGSASIVGRYGQPEWSRAVSHSMQQALRQAELSPNSIGHIHAHGLGTRESDVPEACAIEAVFNQRIPVVAAKSRLAHAGSGSAALEFVASLMALRSGCLFPVQNFHEMDPDCHIRLVTGNDEPAGSSFLNVNFFGRGLTSCVAVGAYAG